MKLISGIDGKKWNFLVFLHLTLSDLLLNNLGFKLLSIQCIHCERVDVKTPLTRCDNAGFFKIRKGRLEVMHEDQPRL